MMSSRSVETLIDSVLQRKMPLFNGTIAATGLSTPQNMSAFLGKQTLQFSGGYFSYDPSGKDGAGFTPSLLDGRSPVSHHSGMDGQNHIIYRQDSKSEEGHSYSSPQCHTPVKQGFTLYTKSPGVSSPTAATSVIVRKQKSGSESASPLTEKSVYLAIPKPIYGHNPCCNELGCVIGQRYSVEHRSPRISNPVYEHDWRQSEAHYTETLPIQRTAQETLVQQRSLQLEPGTEPLKRIAVETYSPGRARTLPGVVEPSYSSYPCTPPRTLFGSLSEQSQHLQTSPRAYPSLYPSHPTYEHMTSEIYQDRSPISKYGQLTQHPMFYYPQANVEVENRTQCKDISSKHREDVPVILKHAIPNSQDHYVLAQSLRGEISLPLSGTETLPNNSLLQGYDYPCYAVPRLHLNTSHIRAALKRPPAMHSNRLNVSPSIQPIDDPIVSSAIPHKEKSSDSLHAGQSHTSPLFLHLDQTSPTAPLRKSEASPPNVQINRFFPQLHGIHRDRPVLSPTSITVDNSCVTHVPCTKQPKGLPTSPVSPVAWLPHLPNHCSGPVHRAVANNACRQQIIYSPATSKKTLSSSATGYPKGTLKRSISHSSTPIVIKEEEDGDLCEVELSKKRQKVKDEKEVGNNSDSPPMPVINHVFSLAPYKAYLQASGVLLSGRLPQRTEQSSEVCEDPPKPQQKQTKPEKVEQQPDVCLVSKENCPDNKTEKPVVEICELKNIKEEKLDPADTDKPVQSSVSQDCVKVIKEEPDECGLSDCGPMLVIKKCKPDDLENKPSLTNENTTSDEVKPVEVTAQQNTSSQGDECLQNEQVLDPPKPISPPQPPPPRPSPLNFKNIPPQCLKLSTYKIILPDSKLHDSVKIPPKPQPVQPPSEITEKTEVKMPVRKHFLELHHSLSKLISESVSASSEQSLRTWLSQLELPEPASPTTKFQKVTCLLGVKGRETCLNEEIKSSLNKVVERLREYTVQERCPFPHVMRAGAVFLPMLVVKELLFPMVQGSLIDQVLQEHKVELRPTTLSEEKILIQLHKRACSSRLRRLMSLKHLPDIYADVVNLLYYTTVCTHLEFWNSPSESTSPEVQKRVQD
ncbi:uncharacterized protein C15orf39 homolog isoform X2 [Sphaeramia orbicularis]|uniref:uncharacterized protein C15orf39 homolog isoform X2 n=1 Tax=Sphaeramia orbicularis TaxID=375764 RepID=UPI00118167D5|nr:uncharacterized protein C15orf39 homolog isoform X2 [Sphaeramia orbicularis]